MWCRGVWESPSGLEGGHLLEFTDNPVSPQRFFPPFFFFLLLLPLTKALGLGKKTAVRERLVSVISLLCASSNFETSLSKQNSCGLQCDGRVHQGCSRRGGLGRSIQKNMPVPEAFCTRLHNPRRNSQGEPSFIFSRGQSFGLLILILHCGPLALC